MNEKIHMPKTATAETVHQSRTVEWVPFERLEISPYNQRTIVDDAAIATLAENIRTHGLIQNLCGLRDPAGAIGIVAGGRRLRALAMLQDDSRFQTVPVLVTEDELVAKAWAASENHLRERPHPADEIREYGKLAEDSIPVPAIAIAFGVREAQVYRRLKLAGLPNEVLNALATDEITLSMAACFTLCDDQDHALTVLERVRAQPVSEHNLKKLLKPSAVKQTDRRAVFVGQTAYVEAGGHITQDLFADDVLFDDANLLDRLLGEDLQDAATSLQAEQGWKWVDVSTEPYIGWYQIEDLKAARIYPEPGSLDDDQAQRYDELCEQAETEDLDTAGEKELSDLQDQLDGAYSEVQKALAGVLIYVDQSGALQTCAGLVRKEDRSAAEAAGILQPSRHAKDAAQKPTFSAKLQADLSAIACGARQSAILSQGDLLLDLLAFQLSGRMGHQSAFGLRTVPMANQPDVEDGYEPDPRLFSTDENSLPTSSGDLARAFRAFRKQGREKIRTQLTECLAALLSVKDTRLGALIDKAAKTNQRDIWTPTSSGFFKRVSGPYLDTLFQSLLGVKPDHPTITSFVKLKKGEKVVRLEQLFSDPSYRAAAGLTDAQLKRIDAWYPKDQN